MGNKILIQTYLLACCINLNSTKIYNKMFMYRLIVGLKVPYFIQYKTYLNMRLSLNLGRDDILICSYFRSGSTWLQKIVNFIVNPDEELTNIKSFTWLDTGITNRVNKSHFTWDTLPVNQIHDKTKIIYITNR